MNQTKESKVPDSAILFCSLKSLVLLAGFTARDGRRAVGLRGLRHVRRCTRTSVYHEHVLLDCFKRGSRRSYKGYSIYEGPPRHFSKAVVMRGTLDTVAHAKRRVNADVLVSVLHKSFSTRLARGKCSGLGAFKTKESVPTQS